MSWLEVSLIVDGELAEAIADVLARFAPNGVAIESSVEYVNAEDEGTPIGKVEVLAYLPFDDQIKETRLKLEESLHCLGMIRPIPEPVFTLIEDQNWMNAWKTHYKPIKIGEQLIIVPTWLESPDPGRIPIQIDPGMAFGTGTHPSTQLCLEIMDRMVSGQYLKSGSWELIDVGCGSGIIAIAGLKLGARAAAGVDLDEAAIKASQENARANGISKNLFLSIGSVPEILSGSMKIRNAELVVVNILAPVIIQLLDSGLADLIKPEGKLILSGILEEQANDVLAAVLAHRLQLVEKRFMGDWVAMVIGDEKGQLRRS